MGVKSSSRPDKRRAKRGIALTREFMNPVDFPRTIPPVIFSIQIGGIAGGLQQACSIIAGFPRYHRRLLQGNFPGVRSSSRNPLWCLLEALANRYCDTALAAAQRSATKL